MEAVHALDENDALVIRGQKGHSENAHAHGVYTFRCLDAEGNLKWEDTVDNVVVNEGKNLVLDTMMAGANYTVNGPYMGLISAVGYTGAPAVTDSMLSHPTWFEVDAVSHYPTVAARLTTSALWGAAATGAKSLTTPVSFTIITFGGTLKGVFLAFGPGAVTTLGSTAGVLYSAGLFTGGDKIVSVGDTVLVSYSTSL